MYNIHTYYIILLFFRLLWFLCWLLWLWPGLRLILNSMDMATIVVLWDMSPQNVILELRKLKSNLAHPLPKTSAAPPMLSAKKSPTRRGTLTHFLQSQILIHFVIFEQVSIHFKTLIHRFYSIFQSFTCPDLI